MIVLKEIIHIKNLTETLAELNYYIHVYSNDEKNEDEHCAVDEDVKIQVPSFIIIGKLCNCLTSFSHLLIGMKSRQLL